MKRWILVLSLATCILVSGCASPGLEKSGGGKSYWMKDGIRVPSEQPQKEFLECRGPTWTKEGMTISEFKNDYGLCLEANAARDRHIQNTKLALGIGQILTFGFAPVSVACGVASMSIPSNKDYFERCMKDKGYRPVEQKRDIGQCMKDKGYEWIEEK